MASLTSVVYVEGGRYAPGDELPAEVASLITNPKAWDVMPEPVEGESQEEGKSDSGEYSDLTVDQLKEEIRLRNSRGAEIKPEGKKADLIAALSAHDASLA